MCNLRGLGVVVVVVFIIIGAIPLDAKGSIVLKFGVYTSDKPTSMVKQFRPLLNVIEGGLQKRLKQPVTIKLEIAKDYEAGIADIVQGKVDFSRTISAIPAS